MYLLVIIFTVFFTFYCLQIKTQWPQIVRFTHNFSSNREERNVNLIKQTPKAQIYLNDYVFLVFSKYYDSLFSTC